MAFYEWGLKWGGGWEVGNSDSIFKAGLSLFNYGLGKRSKRKQQSSEITYGWPPSWVSLPSMCFVRSVICLATGSFHSIHVGELLRVLRIEKRLWLRWQKIIKRPNSVHSGMQRNDECYFSQRPSEYDPDFAHSSIRTLIEIKEIL